MHGQTCFKHQEMFTPNMEVHNINTRNKLKLHKTIHNLILYQKGVYYMCNRIFNKLPEYTANIVGNKKMFISTFSQYLVNPFT
jgi:hypothetical protein